MSKEAGFVRVWDIHPGYLSNASLLGQHVEIHALYSIILGQKKGYANHPETKRWVANLGKLEVKHELTVREMYRRGFKHLSRCPKDLSDAEDSGKPEEALGYVDLPAIQFAILRQKYQPQGLMGRIPLPQNGSEFWAHHKYSVMGRSYSYYKKVQEFMRNRWDRPIAEQAELIAKIMGILELPCTSKALNNLIDHLWGYFKKEAAPPEKEQMLSLRQAAFGEQLDFLFALAQKYQQKYLLQSTVFADLV